MRLESINLAPWCALTTAVLLVASGPPFSLPLVPWFAFAPLLVGVQGASARRAVAAGALAGAVCFAGVGYGVAGYHLGLALWVPGMGAALFAVFAGLARRTLRDPRWPLRVLGPAFVWTALEGLCASPWLRLPATAGVLVADSPAVAAAAWLGVHGLSFAIVLSASAWVEVARRLPSGRSSWRTLPRRAGLAALAPMFATLALGAGLRAREPEPLRSVTYAALQPAIPFRMANDAWWLPGQRAEIRGRFARKIRQAAAGDADLVLWPEGAGMLADFARPRAAQWLPELFAGDRTFLVNSTDLSSAGRRRNRVHALEGPGPPAVYQKRWLVPFAEAGYEGGAGPEPLPTRAGAVGSLVCFEVCFPDPARHLVARGAEWLFASTNDAAFGNAALALWHRATAQLRAAETGRPLLFVSNRGPSAQIGPRGRIVAELPLAGDAVLEGTLRPVRGETPYVRFAHRLPLLALVAGLGLVVAARPAREPRWRRPSGRGRAAIVAAALAAAAGLVSASLLLVARGAGAPGAADGAAPSDRSAVGEEYFQQADNDCGPAALAFLTSYLGDPRTRDEVARHVDLRRDGTTMLDLRDAARRFGFAAHGEQQNYAALLATATPFIAHLSNAHYVVVIHADERELRLFDPGEGIGRMDRARFARQWSGKVLIVRPDEGETHGVRRAGGEGIARVEARS